MAEGQRHSLTLGDRQKLTMTGVTEVVSFDDRSVVLETALGRLLVQGEELELKALELDGGRVSVRGHIGELSYLEPRTGGWLRRLLG